MNEYITYYRRIFLDLNNVYVSKKLIYKLSPKDIFGGNAICTYTEETNWACSTGISS